MTTNIKLGLKENWKQFAILVIANALIPNNWGGTDYF
jgi:hypothetical protein